MVKIPSIKNHQKMVVLGRSHLYLHPEAGLWSQSLCRRTLGSIEVRPSGVSPNREVFIFGIFIRVPDFCPIDGACSAKVYLFLVASSEMMQKLWQLCNGENDDKH